MKHGFVLLILSLSFLFLSPAFGCERQYGERLEVLPERLTQALAQLHQPDHTGAMGRNQPHYFHVRFQLGLHNLAHHAIATRNIRALEYFVSALEYAFFYQKRNGDFYLVIPPEYASMVKPSMADSVSGVAFFISSAGSGIYAVETSSWVRESARLAPLVKRLENVKAKLPRTLEYLVRNQTVLAAVDQTAPNRLLFDALAYYTLAKILHNEAAYDIARRFIDAATAQIHDAGYFIEAGGYDSSYNGVATALAYRLVLMGETDLTPVAERAMAWQKTRVAPSGEILTEGNTRVRPDGEYFLGRRKDVDVGHTLEALMLSAVSDQKTEHVRIADRVLGYYRHHQD